MEEYAGWDTFVLSELKLIYVYMCLYIYKVFYEDFITYIWSPLGWNPRKCASNIPLFAVTVIVEIRFYRKRVLSG
jgi:hypothetical protein